MTKSDLAMLYAPELSVRGALNRLYRWLHNDESLMAELRAANYRERSRVLTQRQLEIIYRYLGEP